MRNDAATGQNRLALSYLPIEQPDFSFRIFRRELRDDEQSVPGMRWLPVDPSSIDAHQSAKARRYAVSYVPIDGHEEVQVRAWTNAHLTMDVLHRALLRRVRSNDYIGRVDIPSNPFIREVDFVLAVHEAGIVEVMRLRAHDIRSIGRHGFVCNFALRVPPDCQVGARRTLELSLTQKKGRVNESYYLDRYEKVTQFLRAHHHQIASLELHDGTVVTLESKLPLVPSFTLDPRTYIFAGGKESKNQFFGLRDHGPYQRPQKQSRLVFLFEQNDRPKSQDLYRALHGDSYETFSGMEKMFRTPISRDNVTGAAVANFNSDELGRVCSTLQQQFPGETLLPVAVVPMSKHTSDEHTLAYYRAKHAFLSRGIASQFVDRTKTMGDRNALKWSISNLALGIFAKMGGMPWRIKPSTEDCLIVGIGQAHRKSNGKVEKYIAYSVLTDSSGVYESIKVLGSTTDRDEYYRDLRENLRQVLLSHRERYRSFVLHVSFSIRWDEIEAIKGLLDELRADDAGTEFVVIKFNDETDFFGFATDHNSRVPYEGAVARLSDREFVVWFSGVGLADSRAPKKPERPVHLRVLYPTDRLDDSDLRRLLQDSLNIAGANWRGFNAKSMPISVYYAKLIAKHYSHFREAGLPEVDMDNLPPWFL